MSLLPNRQSQLLTDHIRSMIAAGVYSSGSRLPSMRQFAGQFSLSIGGVQRVIAKMENAGFLESRRGAGIFVRTVAAPPPRGNVRRIGVILESNPASLETYCAHVLRGIEEKASEHGFILEMDYRGYSISARELKEKGAESDALFLLGMHYDKVLDPVDFSCPVIGVETGNRHGGKASLLSLDPFSAAEAAIDFFRRRGCRKVLVHSLDYPQLRDRAIIFRDRWEPFGKAEIRYIDDACQWRVDNDRVGFPDFSEGKSCGHLFTSNGFYQFAVERYRAKHGEDPNLHNTVLTFDGKSYLVPSCVPGHTVMPDWVEVGRSAFDELQRRLRAPGCPARRIYLDCLLKEYDFAAGRYH